MCNGIGTDISGASVQERDFANYIARSDFQNLIAIVGKQIHLTVKDKVEISVSRFVLDDLITTAIQNFGGNRQEVFDLVRAKSVSQTAPLIGEEVKF